jgi:uridylate kinase
MSANRGGALDVLVATRMNQVLLMDSLRSCPTEPVSFDAMRDSAVVGSTRRAEAALAAGSVGARSVWGATWQPTQESM